MKNLLSIRFSMLLGIVALAFFLRFVHLSTVPPELTWDEAAWGYNAYALGIDGRDEFGKFLPLQYIESFGDFKPPVYAYLAVIPIKLFGLTDIATRLPSVIFGTCAVVLTYCLSKELFGKHRESLALLSAFLLAISPWHILLSRGAFEANIASFFIILGVYAFLLSVRKNTWFLAISVIAFVLSLYTFNTARVVSPILFVILSLYFYKNLLKSKLKVASVGVLGFAAVFPLLFFIFSPLAQLRFHEVNIFTDPSVVERANQQVENDDNAAWSRIIHNRRLAYGVEYLNHYFDHLTPQFLFLKGDGNPKFSIQDVGQLYMWEIPFFIAGAFFLFRKRERYWLIIPIWILVGIAPAATARETPHALRIESVIPTFQILTAYGIIALYESLRSKRALRGIYAIALTLFISGSLLYFMHNYFIHYSREYSLEWQYGYKQAVQYAEEQKKNYDSVYVTNALGRPYIYALFYGQYHPEQFRNDHTARREVFGFVHIDSFGNYKFVENFQAIDKTENNLYIAAPEEVPEGARVVEQFYLLNGVPSLIAFTF